MRIKQAITIVGVTLCMVPTVNAAPKRIGAAEALQQAEDAFYQYNPEKAKSNISTARTEIKRLRKGKDDLTARADALEQRVNRLSSMMQRVEQIEIIDSITVDRDDFFESYRLSRGAGCLYSPDTLPEEFESTDSTVVYVPENGRTMLWGSDAGLMESERFTDGTWDSPVELGQHLNKDGIANYPFLMADGITLYYATKAEDSLGGYDIYISRRSDNGEFLSPQNVGMPYNSPFDDYLLAIDEVTGAGWWATDRNQIPGKLTIYLFIPSEMRINCPVDAADLSDRASLRNWRNTVTDSSLAKEIIARIESAENALVDNTPDFILPLPNGKIYRHWGDFKSDQARRLMEQYVDALEEDAADRRMLEDLRATFKPGKNDKNANKIISLEKKTEASSLMLKGLSNQVIEAELKATGKRL